MDVDGVKVYLVIWGGVVVDVDGVKVYTLYD